MNFLEDIEDYLKDRSDKFKLDRLNRIYGWRRVYNELKRKLTDGKNERSVS